MITVTLSGESKRTLGEALRAARESEGLTQTQLSNLSGISRTTINYIETDKAREPKIETVELLARSCGFDLALSFVRDTGDQSISALCKLIDQQERIYQEALKITAEQGAEVERLRALLSARSGKRLDRAVEAVRAIADQARANEL